MPSSNVTYVHHFMQHAFGVLKIAMKNSVVNLLLLSSFWLAANSQPWTNTNDQVCK